MHRPSGLRVLQLFNGFENTQPDYLAGDVPLSRKGVSPFHGLSGALRRVNDDAISNVSKMLHDTAMAIIRKIGG